jgi:hypothetical protein
MISSGITGHAGPVPSPGDFFQQAARDADPLLSDPQMSAPALTCHNAGALILQTTLDLSIKSFGRKRFCRKKFGGH